MTIQPLELTESKKEYSEFVQKHMITTQQLCDILRIPCELLGLSSEVNNSNNEEDYAQRNANF